METFAVAPTFKTSLKWSLKTIVIVVTGFGLIYTGTGNQDEYNIHNLHVHFVQYTLVTLNSGSYAAFFEFVMPA